MHKYVLISVRGMYIIKMNKNNFNSAYVFFICFLDVCNKKYSQSLKIVKDILDKEWIKQFKSILLKWVKELTKGMCIKLI